MSNDESFDLKIGNVYSRADIHDRYGGQRQGGVSTPSQFPYIFLFSGKQGEEYGYEDGQRDDQVYLYSGEGQLGDMEMARGNRAIREAYNNNKTIHLFEYVQPGHVRYVGEMMYVGHHWTEMPDRTGQLRKGIVFELAFKDNVQ
jgi:5-methylcytosine-specific restriction protein A